MSALARFAPGLLSRLRYRMAWGRWPDFENPTTFDEKLLWLNLFWQHPMKTECADKYTLRDYVTRQGLHRLLPTLFAVYLSADEIDFAQLPDRFVLKCSHGCKCNVFCFDKRDFDTAVAQRRLRRWMDTDYSLLYGELHYARMKPRILCEELLNDHTARFPRDYKVYCFNGRPLYIRCCYDRDANGKSRSVVVDVDWNPVVVDRNQPVENDPISPPQTMPQMLEAAMDLAAPFPFVRIDFYSIRDRLVVGEMTFTPDACINRDYTADAQREMGRLILLPSVYAR